MSSKMPVASGAKTALAPNRPAIITGFVVGFVILLTALFGQNPKSGLLILGNRRFIYETARTSVERDSGLSGRVNLANNRSMLFVFDSEGAYCFWMKDMRFSLDIIWLDSRKKVVYIEPKVQPESFPNTFCPNEPARYVLEINAGLSDKLDIKYGQTVRF